MRRTILVAAALALALPAAGLAKGASKATITGPGLSEAIVIANSVETPLDTLATQTGFFAGVFGQSPDPMLARRPAGKLGPKYRITWTMPGPNNETDLIRQDVYPYAQGGAVTYMRPGQPFFTTERTRGGWFRADAALRTTLIDAGIAGKQPPAVPNNPAPKPSGETAASRDWTAPVVLIALVGGLLLLTAAALLFRRRAHAALTARL